MNKERKVRVPFGILNIGGLAKTKPIMDVDDVVGAEVITPFFCHETFKLKPTFGRHLDKSFALMEDGFHYQRKFRRMVLWDFGDGHTEEGYSVEHYYKKAGYYTITCTFYDINRRAWKNTYHISVVVKEPIPTELRFVEETTKSEVKCSKIERITRLEALLSANCKSDLQIKPLRIFTEKEEDTKYEEIGRNYFEVPSEILKFTRKQWTFLENKQEMVYNSDKVYKQNLLPVKLYTPQYQSLYGRFEYNADNEEEPISLSLYQVIPYMNINEELKTIRVINPNCSIDDILNHDGDWEDYKEKFTKLVEIKQKFTIDDLPSDVTPIGKRAWVDIFYKNDYLTEENHDNVFSFSYDIETVNVTGELENSDNYLNFIPLGTKLKVVQNDLNNVKLGVSLDCFLRKCDETKEYTVDEYLLWTLMKGIDLDFYFFPYIEYNTSEESVEGYVGYRDEEEKEIEKSDLMYYIPKDCKISEIIPEQMRSDVTNSSFDQYSSEIAEEGIEPWISRVRFSLFDCFIFNIYANVVLGDAEKQFDVEIVKEKLIDPDEIEIPKEQTVNEDMKELVDVYMAHPMFDQTQDIKDFFNIILSGQNMINYSLTRSKNFLNDHAYVKTCYLSNLISNLKMMGDEVIEYEKGGFDGVNDLRDFVRILSMNHSDLVGHVVHKTPDIKVNQHTKGQNVSDKINITDTLTIKDGKILTLTRGKTTYDYRVWDESGVEIIIHDKYTNETKIVNFGLCKDQTTTIGDYRTSWGWNLLLPKKFSDCEYKLDEHEKNNIYGKSDLERIKLSMRQLIEGYYDFYILDPFVSKKRIGNYLQNSSINERINDPQLWDEEWGIKHEILLKILRDNGDFKHSKTVIDENLNDEGTTYNVRRIVDTNGVWGEVNEKLNIVGDVYHDTLYDSESKFRGKLQVIGIIYGEGEQFLEMQLVDCSINGERVYTDEDLLQFQVIVKKNNEIQATKQLFNLNSESYQGHLSVKLCGKLKKNNGVLNGMLWDISADLFSK